MLTSDQVSACLVTRGDVDMTEILTSLEQAGIGEIVIWNNQLEQNLGPYGKYAAIKQARHAVIFVQDDDVLLPPESIEELISAYEPGRVVANMPAPFRPHYPDSAMVGFGAIFDRDLPNEAFERLFTATRVTRDDPLFLRESCRAFTVLTPRVLVDVPKRDLPWATDANRLWKQPNHIWMRDRMLSLARQVRDA